MKRNPNNEVWIVETREESDIHTGKRKGPWYPCGYEVHRTKVEANKEGLRLLGPGPYRVVLYRRVKP